MNPVLDQNTLDNLLATVGGDLEFLFEIFDTFLDDSPKQIAAMRRAIQANQPAELRRAAHSLKSNSANLGANELMTYCLGLETLAKENRTDGAEAFVEKIVTAYALVEQALKEKRASG